MFQFTNDDLTLRLQQSSDVSEHTPAKLAESHFSDQGLMKQTRIRVCTLVGQNDLVSPDEFDLFSTYLYLFGNTWYKLNIFRILLRRTRPQEIRTGMDFDTRCACDQS